MADGTEDPPDIENGTSRRSTWVAAPPVIRTDREVISTELALTIFRQMIRTRALEERSIKMSKSGEAYFWIGGPGEESFNVCSRLTRVHKGFGPAFGDYLPSPLSQRRRPARHGHVDVLDHVRQLAMRLDRSAFPGAELRRALLDTGMERHSGHERH